MFRPLLDFILNGGGVMLPLAGVGLALWGLLGLRLQILRKGYRGSQQARLNHWHALHREGGGTEGPPSGVVDFVLSKGSHLSINYQADCALGPRRPDYFEGSFLLIIKQAERSLRRYRSGIRLLCQVAPLLGLLGTVAGMIETFSSLTGLLALAGEGTMAGGISKALISTQMGLLVAVPGVVAGRLLDRREDLLRTEVLLASESLHRFNQQALEGAS